MDYRGDARVGEVEIIEEVPVYRNRWCTVFDDRVRFPSGIEGTYVRLVWTSPSSVAVLPVDRDGRVVLLRLFRHAAREWVLEVPKGFSDGKEPRLQAANELREEAGMEASELREALTLRSDPGGIAGVIHTFVALDARVISDPSREPFETIDRVLHLDINEALAAIQDGSITDAVTVAMLLWWIRSSGGG